MAACLLLLLIVSACAAELGFKPKQQYTYQYEAKQASGIPGLQTQWSAFGLKALVNIQVPTENNLYFKLTDIQHGELKNVHTHQQWRHNLSIPYSMIQQSQEPLGKVFKVVLNGGVVSSIVTTQGEPIWVVNIKKSIAQLFQMDLQKHQSIDTPSMAQPRSYQTGEPAEFFRVMEDSIGGQCETLYETTPPLPDNIKADVLQELSIHSQLSSIHVPVFNQSKLFVVTKTKNYQNCVSRPIWQHMTPGALSCRADDCYLTASNRSATARYTLDGDRSSFRIQTVMAEGEALIYPFGHETEQLWTITNQTLFLKEFRPILVTKGSSFFGEPQPPKTYRRLAFQFPTADEKELEVPDLKSAPQISTYLPGAPVKLIKAELSEEQLVARVKEIIQDVDQLLQYVPEPNTQSVAGYIVEIERALSWLSYDRLQQVYQGLHSKGQKEIFWDTLALAGTNPAVMFILHGVSNEEIVGTRAASILATLPINIKTPTYELVHNIYSVFTSRQVQEKKPLRTTMALSLGNILYQVCVSNTTVEHSYTQNLYKKPFCSTQMKVLMKNSFIPFLDKHIEEVQKPEKLVYIQALGNIGDQQIIPILNKVLTEQEDPVVTSKAIYACYRVVAQYPEKVRKVVAPIFHNVSRPIQVRLAAVTMLLTTNPPIAYWQKIAISTWYEPTNAVVAFIHSTYSTMANITMAPVKPLFEMSRRARITLPLIRPPPGGFALSGTYSYRYGQIIPQYQVAALSHLSLIASKTSLIPSVVYLEFQQYINSILYSDHRWSFNMQGGQQIIDDLMGVEATSSSRQSPRDLGPGINKLSTIVQKLAMEKQPEMKKLQATLYTQWKGAMGAFFMCDESRYSEMLQNARQDNSWSLRQAQKIAYLEDTTVTFASEIGLPVIYSKKMPLVASVRGTVDAKWSYQDGMYEAIMQNTQPFVAFQSLVMVGTVSPFSLRTLGAGVANRAQVSLPLSLKVKLDTQAKKLQVELEPTERPSEVKVAHIQTLPFTTAVKVNKYQALMTSPDTKEIRVSQQKVIRVPFGSSVGVKGYLHLVSDNPIMNFGTFWSELQKRGTAGLTNFWFMMGSLRSRHYDIIVDTANSNFKKFQATFTSISSESTDKSVRQPIFNNQEHEQKVSYITQSTRRLMQEQKQQMQQELNSQQKETLPIDRMRAYTAVATITQKNNAGLLHYNSKFTWVSDAQWYSQMLSFDGETPSKKVCLETKLSFPLLSDSRQTLLSTDISMPVSANLGYGSTCQQHILQMKGTVSRDSIARQYAQNCPEALRCVEHEKRGNPNSADCRIAKNHAVIANYYDLEFTDKDLTQDFRNASYSLDNFAKFMGWPYMSNDPYAQNTPKKTSIKIQMKPAINAMSVHVVKPFETTKFEDVQLPFNMLYEPSLLSMRKSLSKKISDSLYGVDRTVCLVDKLVVKTFDNVTLERQPSECWTLLAMDNSFIRKLAILEKQVRGQPAVRILVNNMDIEIDSQDLRRVKIDGRMQTIDIAHPISTGSSANSQKPLVEIMKIADDTMKVALPQHYVKMLVTKEGVQIHASQLAYRSRLRGICGDFDGEQQDDLVGPRGCLHKRGQEFYEAYRVPLDNESQCQPKRPDTCIRKPLQDQRQGYSVLRRY